MARVKRVLTGIGEQATQLGEQAMDAAQDLARKVT